MPIIEQSQQTLSLPQVGRLLRTSKGGISGKMLSRIVNAVVQAYQFYASGNSVTPEYLGNTPMSLNNQAFDLLFTASVTGGYFVSPAGDGFAQGYNNPSFADAIHGFCTLTQGTIQFTMQYTPAISSSAQCVAIEGSAGNGNPFDTNDQIKFIGASTANSFKMSFVGANGVTTVSTPDLVWNSTAANTDGTFIGWFNTTATRKLIFQIGIDPPAVYCPTLPLPTCSQWHSLRWGKDATAGQSMGISIRNLYLYTTASFQATGNTWCDFNFVTVNTTNMAASSHNSQQVCYAVGSGTRGSTRTDAFYPQWALINNQTTTSTSGFAFDLNLTAADAYGFGVDVVDQPWSSSFMFKVPTLADGSIIEVAGAYDSGGNQNCSLYQTAASGIQTLNLKTGAGGNSSTITVTAGTWYLVCMDGGKGTTGTLDIYDTSKARISGAPVTLACANHNTSRFWLGSPFSTTTSQSAGTYFRYSHLILDGLPSNATPVAPLLQWP